MRKNLDVSADYNSEKDQLTSSLVKFRTMDVSARYYLGKFGIQAGYGSYRTENAIVAIQTGNSLNRYFLRVTRDFKIF